MRIDAIDVYWMTIRPTSFPSSYFYTDDLGKPEIAPSGRGEVATSSVPGIAQAPEPERLKRWTSEHTAFRVPSTR